MHSDSYLAEGGRTGYSASLPRLPGPGTDWRELNKTTWQDWYLVAKGALRFFKATRKPTASDEAKSAEKKNVLLEQNPKSKPSPLAGRIAHE